MRVDSRCPKCSGRLFMDDDAAGLVPGTPELACLTCGWRRVVTLAEITITSPDVGHRPQLPVARPRR